MTEKQDPNSQHVLDLVAEESTLQAEVKQYLSSLSKGSRVKMDLQESTIKKIIQTAIQEINQRYKVAQETPGGDQDPIQEESHIAFYQATQTLQEAQHSPSLFDKQEMAVIITFIQDYRKSILAVIEDIMLGKIPDPDTTTTSLLIELLQSTPAHIQGEIIINFAVHHLHRHHPEYTEEQLYKITREWIIKDQFPKLWQKYNDFFIPEIPQGKKKKWKELNLEHVMSTITAAVKLQMATAMKK